MIALTAMGASELAGTIKSRKTTASEVLEAHLSRIADLDGRIGAFLARNDEVARGEARSIDERLARGEDPGALAGVPVAVKDVMHVRALPTTCGSRILEGFTPPYEATAVKRLKIGRAHV